MHIFAFQCKIKDLKVKQLQVLTKKKAHNSGKKAVVELWVEPKLPLVCSIKYQHQLAGAPTPTKLFSMT